MFPRICMTVSCIIITVYSSSFTDILSAGRRKVSHIPKCDTRWTQVVWFLLQLLYCQKTGHPAPTGQEDGWAPSITDMVVKTEILSMPGTIYDKLNSRYCMDSSNSLIRERSFKYISPHTCNKKKTPFSYVM